MGHILPSGQGPNGLHIELPRHLGHPGHVRRAASAQVGHGFAGHCISHSGLKAQRRLRSSCSMRLPTQTSELVSNSCAWACSYSFCSRQVLSRAEMRFYP